MNPNERIQVLERRLRTLQAVVVFLLLGLGVVAWRGGPGDEVRATAFVLVDDAGGVRGEWRPGPDGARLVLRDSAGRERVRLWHDTAATALYLQDAAEQARVGAAYFAHGGHGVALHGPGGVPTAAFYMRGDLGSLAFYDSAGVVQRIVPQR